MDFLLLSLMSVGWLYMVQYVFDIIARELATADQMSALFGNLYPLIVLRSKKESQKNL